MTGLAVCVAVLAAAAVYGAIWRRRNGVLRVVGARRRGPQAPAAGSPGAQDTGGGLTACVPAPGGTDGGEAGQAAAAGNGTRPAVLTAEQLGRPLGSRATLVQFSTAFCAPCRATRRTLTEVADMTAGVAHVEVDAEANPGLVRSLGIHRTPAVFVLGADGAILRRGMGQPCKPDIVAALGAIPWPGAGPGTGGAAAAGHDRDRRRG